MIDIESLGTDPGSCITSVGAVKFNFETGEIGDKFFMNINVKDSMKLDFKVNGNTVLWWFKQDDEAIKAMLSDPQPVRTVLEELSKFINSGRKHPNIWANAPTFDCSLLRAYYEKTNIKVPWSYTQERCVRTLSNLAPGVRSEIDHVGQAHNALDDCMYQIKYCVEIYNKLIKNEGVLS